MRRTPLLLCVGLLLWAVPPAGAADLPIYPTAHLPSHDYWSPAGSEGATVAGRFDDNAVPDVFVLVDGVPYLVRDVETLGFFHAATTTVNDIALWTGGAPNGRDAIVAVAAGGLLKLHYDDATGAVIETVLESSSAWCDLDFVRTGNLDGGGSPDVVGLAGTQYVLRRNLSDPLGATNVVSIPLAGHALGLVDLSGTGIPSVAIADSAGIKFYSWSGASQTTAFPAVIYRELRAVPKAGGGEFLAALATLPGTGSQLLYIGGTTIDSTLDLGDSLDFVSVAPIVFAPGTRHDLVLNCRGASELVVIRHTNSTPAYSTFNFTANFLVDSVDGVPEPNGTTNPTRTAPLITLDEDGDGDEAVFFFDDDVGVFRVVRNQLVDETEWRPGVEFDWHSPGEEPTIDIDWGIAAPVTVDPLATAIELIVYREPLTAGTADLTPYTTGSTTLTQLDPIGITVARDPEVPLKYIAVVRQVRRNAAGVEVRAWPTYTFDFTVAPIDGTDPVPVNGPVTRPTGGESTPP